MKGYATIHIKYYGEIKLLIHCNYAPMAGENFLELAEKKYYNGTVFHRLVPGFMVNNKKFVF
jgi:cyclophilin family peptidyl-prolyl cis-trans isomerase